MKTFIAGNASDYPTCAQSEASSSAVFS